MPNIRDWSIIKGWRKGGGWGLVQMGAGSANFMQRLNGGCKNLHRCTDNFSQDIIKVLSDKQPTLFVLKTKCLLTIFAITILN